MLAFGDSITYGFSASNFAATAYVPLVAAALGVGYANYGGYGGSLFHDEATAILPKMLATPPPSRYETVVMILGTNDMAGNGADLPSIALFKTGLTQGLLHLTSGRRVPEPRTEAERRAVRQGRRLPSVPDGCRVFVGNTPKQSAGHYVFNGSAAAQALYAAAIADVVASVAAQGRRVYLVDVASAYNPDTMSNDGPGNVHPNDAGHAAIAAAFLAAIRAAS